MNQIFSGATLLGAVLVCALVLFSIAFFMKPKKAAAKLNKKSKSKVNLNLSTSKPMPQFNSKVGAFGKASNEQLLKLKNQVITYFPDFTALMRENHLVIERNAKKVALLTLDANAAIGRRRLGEVTVINFHKLPSVEELRIELSAV